MVANFCKPSLSLHAKSTGHNEKIILVDMSKDTLNKMAASSGHLEEAVSYENIVLGPPTFPRRLFSMSSYEETLDDFFTFRIKHNCHKQNTMRVLV